MFHPKRTLPSSTKIDFITVIRVLGIRIQIKRTAGHLNNLIILLVFKQYIK